MSLKNVEDYVCFLIKNVVFSIFGRHFSVKNMRNTLFLFVYLISDIISACAFSYIASHRINTKKNISLHIISCFIVMKEKKTDTTWCTLAMTDIDIYTYIHKIILYSNRKHQCESHVLIKDTCRTNINQNMSYLYMWSSFRIGG